MKDCHNNTIKAEGYSGWSSVSNFCHVSVSISPQKRELLTALHLALPSGLSRGVWQDNIYYLLGLPVQSKEVIFATKIDQVRAAEERS